MRSSMQLCQRLGAAMVRLAAPLVLLVVIGLATQVHAGQVDPTITWTMPTPFVYGANIPTAVATNPNTGLPIAGTFTYTPAQSTILHVTGGAITLRVTFNPSDTSTYKNKVKDSGSITVTRAPLTVTANASKVYGAAVVAPVAAYSGFKFSDTASVLTGAPTMTHTVVVGSSAINHPITVGVGTLVAADYLITAVNGTYAVTKAPLSVTANAASRAYGAANPAFTGTLIGVVNSDAITATYASSATATTAAGVYSAASAQAITPTLVDPGTRLGNYTVTSTKAALTITQATQTITGFGPITGRTYGNAPFTITGVTGGASGQPVVFTSSNTAVATVSGTTVTITGSGSADIRANQAGNTNYSAAAQVAQTLTVAKAALSVTANSASRAYGAANPAFTGTLTGVVGTDAITASYASSATAATAAGTYGVATAQAITPTLADPGSRLTHYTVTSTKAALTITQLSQSITGFGALAARTYGNAPFTISGVTGGASGQPVVFTSGNTAVATVSGSTVTIVGSGSAVITASQAGNTNYAVATSVAQSLTVSQATLSVTANAASRAYGAANPVFIGTLTGVVGSDGITATYASSANATTGVGTYSASSVQAITPTLVDPNARLAHYLVTSTNAALTITQAAQSITGFGALAVRTYGDAPFAIIGVTGGASGQSVVFTSGNTAVATVTGNTVTIVGSGSAVITASQAGNANYAAAAAVPQTLTVNKAALTVTANAASRAYGSTNPAFNGTLTGVVGTDGITATYASSGTLATAAGVYGIASAEAITATLVDPSSRLGHYNVTSNKGVLTITQLAQSITFAALLDTTVGDADQTLIASASSGLPITFSVNGPAQIIGGKLRVTGAGAVTVTASQVGSVNYQAATPVDRSLLVSAGGSGLLASYFANETLSGTPALTRVDPVVDFDWANGAPASGVPAESFSVRWDGEIVPRYTEAYTLTFRTDDGVRVWLDGNLVVDQWVLRSAADSNYTFNATANQRYRIRIAYYEHTGQAVAKLWWRSISEPSAAVPSSRLFPTAPSATGVTGTGTGLSAYYFANETLSGQLALTRIDAGLPFDWAGGSPASGVPADSFSVRWKGEIQPRFTGSCTVVLRTDDGVRVWLGTQQVINDWVLRGAADSSFTFDAVAGTRYPITIEYYEHQGSAVAQMRWYGAYEDGGLVPASQLYPAADNRAPVAGDNAATVAYGLPTVIPVLANDSDADGDALRVASAGEATYGTATVANGGLSVSYAPRAGFTGIDVFPYVVSDGLGGTALGWVSVTVQSPADLVLHWKFDEDAAFDQQRNEMGVGYVGWDSARTHHAGLLGAWSRTIGKDGNGLSMEGGFIQAYDAADLHLQRMTIAMWVKPTQPIADMGSYISLFDRYDWANNSGFWFGTMGTGELAFLVLNGGSQAEMKSVSYDEDSFGEWIHLAAAYDGQDLIIYRNGVVVASQAVGALTLNYPAAWAVNAAAGFQGSVDDVRLYDHALSAAQLGALAGANPDNAPPVVALGVDQSVVLPATAQVFATVSDDGRPGGPAQVTWLQVSGPALVQFSDRNALGPVVTCPVAGAYGLRLRASDGELTTVADLFVIAYPAQSDLQQGLVAHWKLDDASGAVASDSSGRGNHAQVQGYTTWELGYMGGALQFGAGGPFNDYASAPDSPSLRASQMTISAWMKADRAPSQMLVPNPMLLTKIDWASNTGFQFGFLGPDVLGFRLLRGNDLFGRVELMVPQSGLEGGWHHLCAVYDGAQLRLYRDGVLVGSKQVGQVRVNHGAFPAIFGQLLEGRLDDIRVYDRPLAPQEIDELSVGQPSGPG